MNGFFENTNWVDTSLESISISRGIALIIISSIYTGSKVCKTIKGNDFIAIRYLGHWDEGNITGIFITDEGSLISESLELVKQNYDEDEINSQLERYKSPWQQLSIRLLDGVVIEIVCKSFELQL
jgi:hypothetical protein